MDKVMRIWPVPPQCVFVVWWQVSPIRMALNVSGQPGLLSQKREPYLWEKKPAGSLSQVKE